jgi:hypothetical protein
MPVTAWTYYATRCILLKMFPNDAVFQNDNMPIHTPRNIQSWVEEHEDTLKHLCPAHLPDFNIVEPLWSVLESRVRSTCSWRVVQYSTRHYAELHISPFQEGYKLCYRQKLWPSSVLIETYVSSKTVSIVMSIHCLSNCLCTCHLVDMLDWFIYVHSNLCWLWTKTNTLYFLW